MTCRFKKLIYWILNETSLVDKIYNFWSYYVFNLIFLKRFASDRNTVYVVLNNPRTCLLGTYGRGGIFIVPHLCYTDLGFVASSKGPPQFTFSDKKRVRYEDLFLHGSPRSKSLCLYVRVMYRVLQADFYYKVVMKNEIIPHQVHLITHLIHICRTSCFKSYLFFF